MKQRISWWVNEHQVPMNTTHHMEILTMSMDQFSVDSVVLPPAVMPIFAVSPKHFLQIKAQNNICTIGVNPFHSFGLFYTYRYNTCGIAHCPFSWADPEGVEGPESPIKIKWK